MKILVVTDEVAPQIYHAGIKTRFVGVDVVLSCGDLPAYYLEFIVTMLNVPLYYVLGNHAEGLTITDDGKQVGPGGCTYIDGKVTEYVGLLIAGLGGSMRYRQGAFQYTEAEMGVRAGRLGTRLLRNRLTKGRWLDILVTHAPPFGIHDGSDLCHRGFRTFRWFMERFRPRYLVHGHSHVYNRMQPTITEYGHTVVLNAFPYRVIEIKPGHSDQGAGTS